VRHRQGRRIIIPLLTRKTNCIIIVVSIMPRFARQREPVKKKIRLALSAIQLKKG
jgi:hypothetical protein